MSGFWTFTRKDLDSVKTALPPSSCRLIDEKIKICHGDPTANTIVKIDENTFVDVKPGLTSPYLMGWTTGGILTKKSPPRFFEVERVLSGSLFKDMKTSLGAPTALWNVKCKADTNAFHIDDAKKVHKVLKITEINGYPIDQIMPYWLPIIQSIGRDSRGGGWRMPIVYMNLRGEKTQRPLGAHIPLSDSMLSQPIIKPLLKDQSKYINCIFDMSRPVVKTVGKNFEYLVGVGTATDFLTGGNSSSFTLGIVVGVFNKRLDEKV